MDFRGFSIVALVRVVMMIKNPHRSEFLDSGIYELDES